MTARRPNRERGGVAILLLLAVIALGGTYYLISGVNAMSMQRKALVQERNAAVLNRAKQALIGYVAAQAAKGMPFPEDNPGALPCPEHPWYIGLSDKEGGAGPSIGVANPGYGTANCSSIGRFPWRTIGTEKLVDGSGEPLWYAVGPTWRKTASSTKTSINSNTAGDLSVDGQQVVAVIIAPGPAMSIQAGTSASGVACTARNQVRSAPAGSTLDPLDYLECFSSGTLQFSTAASSSSFNDQVVTVTAADLLPGIEAAVANRIEREIVPALKTVYASGTFGITGGKAVYPYPAPFGPAFPNPGPNGCPSAACAGTSDYQGSAATLQGLLPFNQTQACTVSANDPRCTTSFLVFSKSGLDAQTGGAGTIRTQSSCAWQSNVYVCTGQYNAPSISLTFKVNVTNVAMGLRAIDTSKITCTAVDDAGAGLPTQTVPCSVTGTAMQNDGSATLTVAMGATPDIVASGWGTYANYMINIDRAAVGDHALLDSTNATTGWFVRNEWYRLTYYVVAQGRTAQVLTAAPQCPTTVGGSYTFNSSCLSITNVAPASTQAAMLILAGRSVNGGTRPTATLADYLEGGNATGSFERRTVSSSARFNDRVIVVDSN